LVRLEKWNGPREDDFRGLYCHLPSARDNKEEGKNAMIRISCADYAFPLLPREQRFALLRLLGFEYADIGLFERSNGLRPGQLLAAPRKFGRQLKRDLIQAGLRVSDVFLQTGLTLADSAENVASLIVRSRNRKTFLLTLELCAELECIHITGLPGIVQKGVDPKDSFDLAVEEVCWRHHVASSSGICYAIKPHVGSICWSMAGVHSFLDLIPGLTLTLDYAQFVSQKISSRDVHHLLPNASHVHVRGGAPHRLQVGVDECQIDFAGMIKRLYNNRYNGFLAIEYLRDAWMQCNHTDNVSETILLKNRLVEYLQSERDDVKPQEQLPTSSSHDAWLPASPPATLET
jgi:sugar phosphate isomerase/epimerase